MATKTINSMLQTPAIKQLITELDEIGYEIFIKPKPLRSKEQLAYQVQLDKQLRDSLIATAIKKQQNAKRSNNDKKKVKNGHTS